MTMTKHISAIVVIILLSMTPIAGCYTQHFHNLTIIKADSFDWKTHDHIIPDSIHINPDEMANVTMKRWGYTVKFISDTDEAIINYTVTNHKWQNRKIKLYITGERKRALYADSTGTVSFSHAHTSSDEYTHTLKPTWSFRNMIDYITSKMKVL